MNLSSLGLFAAREPAIKANQQDTAQALVIVGVVVWVFAMLVFWGQHRPAEVSAGSRGEVAGTQPGHPTSQKGYSTTSGMIGIDAVVERLGNKTPIGRGIAFGHVEGEVGDYCPDIQSTEYEGMVLSPRSGPSKSNGHANATSRIIYGKSGLAPGVPRVNFYPVSDWIRSGCLNVGRDRPPDPDGARVITNSWISMLSDSPDSKGYSERVLRRVDYLVDHEQVVVVAGVNNGADTAIPAFLASAYNVISVGQAEGHSSGGYTRVEGVGRCKPDIVAPGGLTSFSTPVVAAVVARLLETADQMRQSRPAATRTEVIRAVLYAGAEKPAKWRRALGKPFDPHLGVGSVRFDQSYAVLSEGVAEAGLDITRDGWEFRAIPRMAANNYYFDLEEGAEEVSIVLVWNRRIMGKLLPDLVTGDIRWSDSPRLADLDLRFYRLGGKDGEEEVSHSMSGVDNVEHLNMYNLGAGRYRLRVVRKDRYLEDWDYALAWRISRRASGGTASAATQAKNP